MNIHVKVLKDMVEQVKDEVAEFENRKYAALGKTVLATVVKPYCDKTGMRYLSGNGGFFFVDVDGKAYQDEELATQRRAKPGRPKGPEGDADEWFIPPGDEERDIISLLNIAIGSVDCLGACVPNYTPEKEIPKHG